VTIQRGDAREDAQLHSIYRSACAVVGFGTDPRYSARMRRRRYASVSLFALALLGAAHAVRAEEVTAFYRATWAGLPAAQVRLNLGGTGKL
jgi:hypothetical protein